MIVFGAIVPHPPICIPEIGGDESEKVAKTREAYQKLSEDLVRAEVDTVILISPHMTHYPHLFTVCGMTDLAGSFESFGSDITWRGQNDVELAEEIVDELEDEELPSILYVNDDGSYEIDHGAMVPLYFFQKSSEFPFRVLPVSYSYSSRADHYTFGQAIASVCNSKSEKRVAVIASGDLSHRLVGQNAKIAKDFDKKFIDLIKKGDEYAVMNIDEEFVESAGECGYRSVLVLLGALSGKEYKPTVYSYEGPFGVGYAVINMNVKSD